jgi:hypothetical protein
MEQDNFSFRRDATDKEKLMFFIATYNILMKTYILICSGSGSQIERLYGPSLAFKLLDFKRIWGEFVDTHKTIIDRALPDTQKQLLYYENGVSSPRDNVMMKMIVQVLRCEDRIFYALGEKFIAENFLYIGEIVGEFPDSEVSSPSPRIVIPAKFMTRVRKLVKIVDLIFKHSENRRGFIIHNRRLMEAVSQLKSLFIQFVQEHRAIIDPLFQSYGSEVSRGTMDFDPEGELCDADGVPLIKPMGILLNAIKAEMFNQDRQDRLLLGDECECLENNVIMFRELGEMFISTNIEAIEKHVGVFLRELREDD